MTKLIPWREALHPRNPFSGEFVHSMASSAPVTRNGLPSHLSRADMMLPLSEQLDKLLRLKSEASSMGDDIKVASITNEELAVRIRINQPPLFKSRPIAPWDIDKAARKRDGDGDGFTDDVKNKRIARKAPVKRVSGVKRVAPKKAPTKKPPVKGGATSAFNRVMAGRNTKERQDNFLAEAMQLLGGKPKRKPAPPAGDAMSARLGRMGAKPPAKTGDKVLVGDKNRKVLGHVNVRPKSPFSDGMVTNSRGQREDPGNRAERKMVEAEMAADKTPKKPQGKAALPLDFKDPNLADLAPERRKAAQAWADAMAHAQAGNRDKFDAALADFFENDQTGGDGDVRDYVDDYLDEKKGDEWYDQGLKNINKWKVKIETERRKFFAAKMSATNGTGPSGNKAYEHLKKGGSLRDAPSDGLADAIKAMPERFDMHENKSKGVSPNWWVVDKTTESGVEVSIPVKGRVRPINTTNEVWVLKASAGSDFFDIPEDVLNENLGHELQQQLKIDAPQLKFATRADAKVPMVMQEHFEQFYDGKRTVASAKKFADPAAEQWMAEHMPNPEEAVDLALFDFLIGNQDRHHGNWFVMAEFDETDGNDKYHIGVFDNGFGFYGTWAKGLREKDPRRVFQSGYPKKFLRIGLKAMGGDRQKFAAAIDDFIKRARTVEVAKFEKRLKDAGLSAAQKSIVQQQLGILQERIDNLDKYKQDIINGVR